MQATRGRSVGVDPDGGLAGAIGWLIEELPDGIVVESADGHVLAANPQAAKLLGLGDKSWSDGSVESLLAAPYVANYRRRRAALHEQRSSAAAPRSLHLRTRGRRSFPIELDLAIARQAGVELVVHTVRRVTDAGLRERENEALLSAIAGLGAQAEPEAVLRTLVEQAAALFEAERAHYAVPWQGRIVIRGRWSDGRWTDDHHEPRPTGILASVLESGLPFRSNDVIQTPNVNRPRAEAQGLRSQLTAPILDDRGKAMGFVVLQNSGRPEGFTARDERILVSVCAASAAILRRAQQSADRLEAEHERAQLVDERARLANELERRVVELQTANRELESFSYSISHDLRAPLRSLDGFSRILLEEYTSELSETPQRYLRVVRESAQEMGRLVDDLLAFSRLGRQTLKKQAVDLDPLVHQVVDSLGAERQGRNVEITIGELPVCRGDLALLRQVFANLIGNALKFSRQWDPALITIDRCRPEEEPGEVVCVVRDNGAGFDMQYADKLFGVFQRLHRAEEYEGTGVGLAIVERIVTRHGGRVWAEAEVGEGAAFYVALEGEEPGA